MINNVLNINNNNNNIDMNIMKIYGNQSPKSHPLYNWKVHFDGFNTPIHWPQPATITILLNLFFLVVTRLTSTCYDKYRRFRGLIQVIYRIMNEIYKKQSITRDDAYLSSERIFRSILSSCSRFLSGNPKS